MQQDDVTTETLASNIRDARHALGWSVDKLADKADLPVDHVRRLERGGGCSGPDLAQLSRALGIPAHVLVPDHEHSNADDLKPRKKWPTVVLSLLFLLVAVRTLLASFGF